jgi:hypothetical protein
MPLLRCRFEAEPGAGQTIGPGPSDASPGARQSFSRVFLSPFARALGEQLRSVRRLFGGVERAGAVDRGRLEPALDGPS